MEIILSILFVALSTFFMYGYLSKSAFFWNAQFFWNIALAVGWIIVSLGYYNQGWIIQKNKSAEHVSVILPSAVFIVQCILFVKGIYYQDWALIAGAVMVNSGVTFNLYQIFGANKNNNGLRNKTNNSIL